MSLEKAFIALNRFGYGADQSGLDAVAHGPQQFLKSQLQSTIIPEHLADQGGLDKSRDFLVAARKNDPVATQAAVPALRDDYMRFIGDLTTHRLETKQPFVERMVAFWTNHFTISLDKRSTLGLFRDYQYKAIRPHITGYFYDLLLAVTQHPAMLAYLDNITSFGPNSLFGKRSGKGLNENLAREILELHTLGVDGGYTQKDVTEFAKILTGWSLNKRPMQPIEVKFAFTRFIHEPGDKVLLGRTFKEDGINEGLEALKMLAAHPSTAQHLARKIATHFVSDAPPESLISRLEKAYNNSGGHLGTVMRSLIDAPETWEEPLAKLKPTPDFVISAFRATGYKPNQIEIITSFDTMDYRAFNAPSPQGFSDQSTDWAAPGAVMKRIEWAQEFAQRLTITMNPYDLAQKLFGPVMSAETAFSLKGAESGVQGLVLLLMSLEFQRR